MCFPLVFIFRRRLAAAAVAEAADRALAEALDAADQRQTAAVTAQARRRAADVSAADEAAKAAARQLAARDDAEQAAATAAAAAAAAEAAADDADAEAAALAVMSATDDDDLQRDRALAEALAVEETVAQPWPRGSGGGLLSGGHGSVSLPGLAASFSAAASATAAAAAAVAWGDRDPKHADPAPTMHQQRAAGGFERDRPADACDALAALAVALPPGQRYADPDFGPHAPLRTAMPDPHGQARPNHGDGGHHHGGGNGGGGGGSGAKWEAWHRPDDVEVDAGTGARRTAAAGRMGFRDGFSWTHFGDPTAPGEGSDPSAADVQQGALGDCWCPPPSLSLSLSLSLLPAVIQNLN
jgi:hypothetical protein